MRVRIKLKMCSMNPFKSVFALRYLKRKCLFFRSRAQSLS